MSETPIAEIKIFRTDKQVNELLLKNALARVDQMLVTTKSQNELVLILKAILQTFVSSVAKAYVYLLHSLTFLVTRNRGDAELVYKIYTDAIEATSKRADIKIMRSQVEKFAQGDGYITIRWRKDKNRKILVLPIDNAEQAALVTQALQAN